MTAGAGPPRRAPRPRVFITRPAGGSADAWAPLTDAGFDCIHAPAIRFSTERADGEAMLRARLRDLDSRGGWLILPSPAAVEFFSETEAAREARAERDEPLRMAALGEASAGAMRDRGWRPAYVARGGSGADLARELPLESGDRMALIAGAREGRPELAEGLRARGLEVTRHALYETLPDVEPLAILAAALAGGGSETIAVFSPSAVRAIVGAVGEDRRAELARHAWIALGGTTAGALREAGIEPRVQADRPTIEAMIHAILNAPDPPDDAGGPSNA